MQADFAPVPGHLNEPLGRFCSPTGRLGLFGLLPSLDFFFLFPCGVGEMEGAKKKRSLIEVKIKGELRCYNIYTRCLKMDREGDYLLNA